MPSTAPVRKRPVNLTLNEALVERARSYTSNLSATIETLLVDFVSQQQQAARSQQQRADGLRRRLQRPA